MESDILHILSLSLLLLLPLHSMSQTHQISLGSSVSTTSRDLPWAISSSGEFAFGFRRTSSAADHYLLAVWFNNIRERTIVWHAKTDDPVPAESRAQLTKDGQFLLSSPDKKIVWSAKSKSANNNVVVGATSVSMLDDGNLVVQDSNSTTIWESFDEPTDTILPTQTLGFNSRLSSRLTDTDYSKGRFQLILQGDGNLVLYSVNRPTEFIYTPYWASNTVGSGSELVVDKSGYISLKLKNGESLKLTPPELNLKGDLYHRATLDSDGVFIQYIYPKTPSEKEVCLVQSWNPVRSFPENICMALRGLSGSGVCGFNSYCMLDGRGRPSCECPPGYSFLDPTDVFKGCKPDFPPHRCGSNESSDGRELFMMEELSSTDWPDSDFKLDRAVDEDQCKDGCWRDCFCAVSIFSKDGSCWKKKLPLSNGRMDPRVDRKAFIKVPRGNLPPLSLENECSKKKDQTSLIVVGSLILGSSVFLNVLLAVAISVALLYSYHRRELLKIHSSSSLLGNNLSSFTYKELEEATDGFNEEIGRGSFGSVYKGVIASNSRDFIAVKKLDKVVQEGEREFQTEVSTIGQTHHRNLVRLLGFCDQGAHRLLVYEFMRNGSLATFLFGSLRLDWNQRIRIVFGIARGLLYLHEGCSTQIIHCDIKPQNILLDDYFTARISDFGLAKISKKMEETRSITGIRGTRGYVAPEWFKNVTITAKVDVYSYGVMLLEIICCRKNLELETGCDDKVVLTDWAFKCYREGRLDMLVENDEEALHDMRRLEKLVMVAIWCVQEDPTRRPSMKKVMQMIEGLVKVSPPDPPFSINPT